MNLDWESMTLPERKHDVNTPFHGSLRMNKSRYLPGDIKVQCGTMNGDIKADIVALKKVTDLVPYRDS